MGHGGLCTRGPAGKGLLLGAVVATSPEDKKQPCPLRGQASSWGHFQGSLMTRTVDISQQHRDGRAAGLQGCQGTATLEKSGMACPQEKTHLPTLPPCHPHPPLQGQGCLSPPAAWDPRKMAGSLGVAMSANSHTGRGSRNGYTRTKIKDPKLLGKARTCLELLPVPEERQDRALQGTECQEHFQTHTASVPPKYR